MELTAVCADADDVALEPPRSVIVLAAPAEIAGTVELAVLLAGEDATPTALLEKLVVESDTLVVATDVAVAVAEASTEVGKIVVIDTPDSVAMLERKLEASEALKVCVSVGRVVVPAGAKTVTVTV